MYCINCGKQIEEGTSVCPYCGKSIVIENAEKVERMDAGEIGFPANYYRGIEAVGGTLFLNDAGIIFKPHKMNIQKGELFLNYDQMRAVETRKTLGVIPNGVIIYAKDDKQHKFVINNSKRVIEYIRSRIQQ